MTIKEVPRIILRGDLEEANLKVREGIRQLNILKDNMSFQSLDQDARKIRYTDGSEITCRSIFGINDVQIYVPRKEGWKWSEVIVPRFFAKVKVEQDYKYYWIYFGKAEDVLSKRIKRGYAQPPPDEHSNNIVVFEISNSFERTEEEVLLGHGFHFTLEQALTPFVKWTDFDTPCFAVKAFMLEDSHKKDEDGEYVKERWVATTHYLMHDRRAAINVGTKWTPPPPCEIEDMPCPPTQFYCDIDKKILVWYGSYEIFMGALVIRFNDLDIERGLYNYTWNSVAASGFSIVADQYRTLEGTKEDIPINMMPDVASVTDTEISFYLSRGLPFDRPGLVTIDWINYEWGYTISAAGVDKTKHWYWSAEGFEQKPCASFSQSDFEEEWNPPVPECSEVDVDYCEYFSRDYCPCRDIYTQLECEGCSEIKQVSGGIRIKVSVLNGYESLYEIKVFDDLFKADTIYRNFGVEESKGYRAYRCVWDVSQEDCDIQATYAYDIARRNLGENLRQKYAKGLSALWLSNNVAYFFKEQNRNRCIGSASQDGVFTHCWTCSGDAPFGGPNIEDFYSCKWLKSSSPWPLWAEECPSGLGKCFVLSMPGEDWLSIDNEYVEESAGIYILRRESNQDNYEEPLVRKYKTDRGVEFDVTEIYKTYYLDDRATDGSQGLIIAGKGVKNGNLYWEVYHEYIDKDNVVRRINITEELLKKLNCEQHQLIEIGLI